MSYVFDKPDICDVFPAIGGGQGYNPDAFEHESLPSGPRITRDDADLVVSSADELDDDVPPGSVVWIESDAVLDAGWRQWTFGSPNVTIASGRGLNGSDGALIRTDQRVSHQFWLKGDGCRVTGIRLRGPEPNSFGTGGYPASEAISIDGDNVEIDNSILRGWTHAGIEVGRNSPASPFVHHCDFVDCNSEGLGYGLTVFHGHPVIQACYSDNNRHSWAGDGAHDAGWTIVDCIWGEHHRYHAGDMHEDRTSQGDAGRRMVMKRCIALSTHNWKTRDGPDEWGQETVSIRAIPREAFVVRNNVFRNKKPTEPMRDHKNEAFNVWYAGTFEEGKVEGAQSNVYEWQDGDRLPDRKGPTRDPSVTGFTGSGAAEDHMAAAPDNPTDDRADDEEYDVVLRGTGNDTNYELTAAGGVEYPEGEERNDRIEGRTASGHLSTAEDRIRCTGPITALRITDGDPDIEVEIDGTTYYHDSFPDTEAAEDQEGSAGAATLTVDGTTYELSIQVTER